MKLQTDLLAAILPATRAARETYSVAGAIFRQTASFIDEREVNGTCYRASGVSDSTTAM